MVAVKEAHALAIDMLAQHDLLDWKVRWNRKAGEAGCAQYSNKTITLSALAVERWGWDEVINLLKHEVAHALVGPGHGHKKVWKKQMLELGGKPAEFCPTFSTKGEWLEEQAQTPSNLYGLLVVLGGTAFVSAPAAIIGAVISAAYFIVRYVRNARALPDKEREAIERAVLNP